MEKLAQLRIKVTSSDSRLIYGRQWLYITLTKVREKLQEVTCLMIVTLLPNVTKCYTEIEIELERELEKDKTIVEQPNERYDYASVINYLNEVTGSSYRNASSHQTHIRARYKEGYTLEDFKQVIDTKSAEWKNDKEYSKFLRPRTLFGNKFDDYLNQKSNVSDRIVSNVKEQFS